MKFSGKFASAAIFAAFGVAAMAVADIGPFSSIGHITRTSSSLTNSLIGGVQPKLTLKILEPGTKSISVDGIHRTPYGSIDAVVTSDNPVNGKVTFLFGGKTVAHDDGLIASSRRRIDFLSDDENRPAREFVAQAVLKDGKVISSNKINLEIDTEGPQLLSAKVVGDPTAASVALRLQFRSDDLKEPIAAGYFAVGRKLPTGHFDPIDLSNDTNGKFLEPTKNGASVTLAVAGPLVVGEYRVTVDDSLEDLVGNPAGQVNLTDGSKPQIVEFSTGIFRPTGPAIDFPQFTQREKLDPDTNFNPGDHVESRVVRLYYNRDAHRVAQIINRDIQQWNEAGVNNARTIAKSARSDADKARRDRENEEADAITTSEQMKTLERQLTVAQRAAEKAQQRFDRIKETKRQVDRLKEEDATANKSEIARLENDLKRETGDPSPETGDGSTQANLVVTARGKVTSLESQINQQRQLINAAEKRVANAARDEQIANRTQFEAEVASGTADPDSYAPADLSSIDPVMQVSISVIGEGVIQLRGPIRGINEIRTMINQIDSPLGQVKVGLFTVQINGEEGDKMDEVAARLEGYIDLSRFLTNQSLQLLRRAVQETAGQIASQYGDQYPQHRQIDRDRKYVYAFFGRDFVDELYEMDSEFLRTENKLLSIHAMDTVSLPQATFILALAKNSIREQILDRFMTLVQTELPVAEYSQRRTAGMLKRSRDINAFRRLISIPGFPKDPERVLAKYRQQDMQKYCKKAAEIYRFSNLMNFFRADVYNDDVMTPLQREFIRLAQIFKSQMVAEIELKQRVVERALIQDSQGNEEQLRKIAHDEHDEAVKALKAADAERVKQIILIKSEIDNTLLVKLGVVLKRQEQLNKRLTAIGAKALVEKFGPRDVRSRIENDVDGSTIEITPWGSRRPYAISLRKLKQRRSEDSKAQIDFERKATENPRMLSGIRPPDQELWSRMGGEWVANGEMIQAFVCGLTKPIGKSGENL
ncbi:MAG: hypothetical protein ACI8P0_004744 [Planctomycetaceae bacterium]|jgi:hypothetical protein